MNKPSTSGLIGSSKALEITWEHRERAQSCGKGTAGKAAKLHLITGEQWDTGKEQIWGVTHS